MENRVAEHLNASIAENEEELRGQMNQLADVLEAIANPNAPKSRELRADLMWRQVAPLLSNDVSRLALALALEGTRTDEWVLGVQDRIKDIVRNPQTDDTIREQIVRVMDRIRSALDRGDLPMAKLMGGAEDTAILEAFAFWSGIVYAMVLSEQEDVVADDPGQVIRLGMVRDVVIPVYTTLRPDNLGKALDWCLVKAVRRAIDTGDITMLEHEDGAVDYTVHRGSEGNTLGVGIMTHLNELDQWGPPGEREEEAAQARAHLTPLMEAIEDGLNKAQQFTA